MNEKELEKVITDYLEDKTLEEFFEEFDLTPIDVVQILYDDGQLDDDLLERMRPSDA